MNSNSPRVMLAAATLFAVGGTTTRADITYTLNFDPASSPEAQQVANSVAVAAAFYNQHGSFNKHWNVYHNPGIPTAEANYSGYMGYGGSRNERVVFHEAAHTFGMGTTSAYSSLVSGGVWGGQHGNQAQFDTYNTYGDGLHGDGHAIWPGGFNYDSEDGFIQRFWHTRVMAGIRADMGILSITREAENELVHPGDTAEFSVVSPVATSYQWHKDGAPVSNGGDISGATSPTLRIANAATADQGSYRCAVTGAGETLFSRPRQLWVDPAQQLGHLAFDGNVTDSSGNGNNGTAFGSPAYTTGKVGQAIDLDGVNDHVELPAAAVQASEFTVATWVNWDGGNSWQRIFDFGNNTHQFLFLTPQSGSGTLRLGFKDAINGVNSQDLIDAPALPTGQWVHLAAVLNGDYATLYVNGEAVGSKFGVPVAPCDFLPTRNYIGKSQFADPLFNGRIDDFRIYNHALSGAEIWNLWGQSPNSAPVFTSATIDLPVATVSSTYSGQSLGAFASDADFDTLTFAKLDGPAWLTVASDGTLSGTPGSNDFGSNSFIVRVTDPAGASSDAEVRVEVGFSSTSPVAHWTFEEGTANTYVPYGQSSAGQYDGSLLDVSGNGNHLSAWSTNWAWYRAETPAPTTPQTGNSNSLSVQNSNNYPAMSAIGTSLTNWSPAQWTIEAAIRPDNAANGFQTFMGRDSQGAYAGNPALAALYFSLTPDGALRIMFTDAAGNNWNLQSAANAVESLKWQAVAATSDGNTLSLHLKNITDGDPNYTLLGTLDISASANPTISTGSGDGSSWDPGVITVGRGLYNGGHTDRFFGHLDDIRLYARALNATEFLYSAPGDATPPAAPSGLVASAGDGSVALDWSNNTEPDLASYTVYRSTTSSSGYASIASGLATSAYTDNTAMNGTTYYYVVTATDTSSNVSTFSNEASATPETAPNNPPQFASSLLTKVNATEGSAYSGSIAGDASDPDTGDTLTFAKLGGPAWLSVASNGTLAGTPAATDVGTNQWTVEVTDSGSLSDTAILQITVDALAGPATYGATGETTVSGTIVSGSYASTLSSDNSYEQLREIESGGKPNSRYSYLEHIWSFDIGAGGSQVALSVEAHHSANSEGDDFVFAYSTDGVNFIDALTVTKTADDNVPQTMTLPAGLSGVIQIRVNDTDRAPGARQLDSVYVDALGLNVTP